MLLKTAFREIKTSLGRYLAILAIIALGVGFFAGLRVTRTAMISTADHYLKDLAMFDDRILSTLGWTEEDVDAFRKLDGVSAAEGARSADVLCVGEDGSAGYRPAGYSRVTTDGCDDPCTRLCGTMLCCNLLGGGGYFCCI